MSTEVVTSPQWILRCDECGSESGLISNAWHPRTVRCEVEVKQGWQVRPYKGKGSVKGPDLCPRCKTKEQDA